jgi:sulfur-carrier protein adenylyltransferase/sulfurtransferase
MNTRIIFTIIVISLGSIAAILPKTKTSSTQLTADELLMEMKLQTYVVSTDELADLLISNDPAILLIDVRDSVAYQQYHLPGAINIPLKDLLHPDWIPYVDQLSKKNIFYSNGTTLSNEAWIVTKQLGFRNNYVLGGGLNEWFSTIISPERPASTDPNEIWALYETRKAASMYFSGSKPAAREDNSTILPPIPRKKKTRVQGGCS